jgi:hypothetical protein
MSRAADQPSLRIYGLVRSSPPHPARTEPWGQTVARLQSPEGAIVGISYIPLFHEEN